VENSFQRDQDDFGGATRYCVGMERVRFSLSQCIGGIREVVIFGTTLAFSTGSELFAIQIVNKGNAPANITGTLLFAVSSKSQGFFPPSSSSFFLYFFSFFLPFSFFSFSFSFLFPI
jgi:hypothetical protein